MVSLASKLDLKLDVLFVIKELTVESTAVDDEITAANLELIVAGSEELTGSWLEVVTSDSTVKLDDVPTFVDSTAVFCREAEEITAETVAEVATELVLNDSVVCLASKEE